VALACSGWLGSLRSLPWPVPELGGCGGVPAEGSALGSYGQDFAWFDKCKISVTRTTRAISCFHFLRLVFNKLCVQATSLGAPILSEGHTQRAVLLKLIVRFHHSLDCHALIQRWGMKTFLFLWRKTAWFVLVGEETVWQLTSVKWCGAVPCSLFFWTLLFQVIVQLSKHLSSTYTCLRLDHCSHRCGDGLASPCWMQFLYCFYHAACS